MTTNDWWAKKLGTGQTPRQAPPVAPNPQVPYIPQVQQPNVQVEYDAETDRLTSRARSKNLVERCPECNSGNYFAPQGTQRMRCYDCGYPVMQSASGGGMPSGSSGGNVQKTKQVASTGFNPNIIVDRVQG